MSTTDAADTAAADTSTTDATAADTATVDAATPDPTLAEIADMAKDLGITPGQLKGRLEASRKWEERAKQADQAAEAARIAALSDTERQIEEARAAARDEGKAAALSEFGSRVAAAEIKAALTGIVPDPAAIVDDLNIARYLTDTGEVDAGKVAELKAKYQAFAKPATSGSADGGPLGAPQAVKSLDEQIAEARASGNTALAISLNNQKLAALAVPS